MQSRYVLLTAATLLTIAGTTTSASAKTKSTGVKINTVKSSTKTVTGKATPGAKVTVTRYKVTYATGKANKTGVFKLKLNRAVTANWHYRVTATKKGYKTTVKHFGVKVAPVKVTPVVTEPGVSTASNVNVDELKAQIANLQAQLSSANKASIVQINALNNKLNSLQNQLDQTNKTINSATNSSETDYSSANHNGMSKEEYDAAWKKMIEVQNKLDEKQKLYEDWHGNLDSFEEVLEGVTDKLDIVKQGLLDNPKNQLLQDQLLQLQNDFEHWQGEINDTKHAKEIVGDNIMDLKDEIDALDKEYWAIYKAIGA